MAAKIGWAKGRCRVCGRTLRAPRPVTTVFCDCWELCPICSPAYTVRMDPYTPDLTPHTYGPIEGEGVMGDSVSPMNILRKCPQCGYYSSRLPVEVQLA